MIAEKQRLRVRLEDKVERGARVLDDYDPHWFEKVDLSKLDMSDCDTCVVGQLAYQANGGERGSRVSGKLYGDLAVELMAMAEEQPGAYLSSAHEVGFDCAPFSAHPFDEFNVLQELWTTQIERRLNG